MRYLLLPALLLLTTGLFAQTPMAAHRPTLSWEASQNWAVIQDADGRFQLLSPAKFTHAVDSVETALGRQVYHTFHLAAPDPATAENAIYAISYVDYPTGTIHHDSTELVREFMLGTEEEAAAAVGGEIVYSTDKELSGYPARQWRIDYNGGRATARTLAGVVGNRYYEVKVFSVSASGINQSANKFFDSVRLYAPPKAGK